MPRRVNQRLVTKHRLTPRLLGLLLFSVGGGMLSAQTAEDSVAKLQSAYRQALDLASTPLLKLEARYVEELNKLKITKQTEGDLPAVLAVQAEIENYGTPDAARVEKSAELKRLREIYDESRERLEGETREKRLEILQAAAEKFEELKTELTKNGEIDRAVKAGESLKEVNRRLEALKSAAPSTGFLDSNDDDKPLWSLESKRSFESVLGCRAEREGGKWVLTSDQRDMSHIQSDQSFKPPFVAKIRAMTDSREMRFFYNRNQIVIFSWSTDPQQLRLVSPAGGRPVGLKGKGFVEPGVMHDIEIRLTTRSMRVYADGKLRGELSGTFRDLEGTFGIGPAFSSKITVESFEIFGLGND
ncbi:MAG: hypothetical protein KDN19_00380 [Verrucomicrobiae bacterium]|nr:hypothetical protein [Verrucomicrobiae bacterium]